MKFLISALLVLTPLVGFGQQPLRPGSIVYPGGSSLAFVVPTPGKELVEATLLAGQQAIAAGHLFLLLQGGILPVVYPTDQKFCEKCGLAYWQGGCTGPSQAVVKAYNILIFNYLKNKYGQLWWREARKDVRSLKEWKKKQSL